MSAEDSAFIDKRATDMVEGRLLFSPGELPGLWVGIWDREKGVHVRGYGKAEVGARDADADDFIRIGGLTRTFVATAVLDLVAEGRLRLSDAIEDHAPALVERFPELRGRTVRQLLSMTSGLPGYFDAVFAELVREPSRAFTPDRLMALAMRYPVARPGPTNYSDTDYIVLGQIVEEVTGRSLAEVIEERVTEPLGISDARLPPSGDTKLPEPASHGYAFGCGDGIEERGLREGADVTDWSVSWAQAAGAMYARFSDLGVWGASMLGNELLPDSLASQRLRTRPDANGVDLYGLGIGEIPRRFLLDGTWYAHAGFSLGWHVFVFHNPEAGTTMAVAANACGGEYLGVDLALQLYPR